MEKKEHTGNKPIVRKQYLYALLAAVAVAGLYYAAARFGIFSSGPKTPVVNPSEYKLFTKTERKIKVVIFFGDAESDGLKAAQDVIYESAEPINRVKQVLLKMFAEIPAAGAYIKVLPDQTRLREVYQDKDGILYLDLSREFSKNCKPGITSENLAVYSIVDTIFYNFQWVKGVRFLIDGAEKQDMAGNISLGEVFRPDMDLSSVKL
jgi:spore germination protein GerM